MYLHIQNLWIHSYCMYLAFGVFWQDNYNEQIDMWSVGCIYAELLQMLDSISDLCKAFECRDVWGMLNDYL